MLESESAFGVMSPTPDTGLGDIWGGGPFTILKFYDKLIQICPLQMSPVYSPNL